MRAKAKRELSGALAIGMIVLVFAATGCGEKRPDFDISSMKIGEGITLKYWAPRWTDMWSIGEAGEVELYLHLEELTGVHIEFVSGGEVDPAKFLLKLIESDDLPDIIEGNVPNIMPSDLDSAIDDGIILDLTPYLLSTAPNLYKVIRGNESAARAITSPTGRYYLFPSLALEPTTRVDSGLLIRRKWLEHTGLQPPITIEDWYVLPKLSDSCR